MSALNDFVAPNVNTANMFNPTGLAQSLAGAFGQAEKRWEAVVDGRSSQDSAATMTPFERRQLVGTGLLRATYRLDYSERGIARELRRMAGPKNAGPGQFLELTGLLDAATDEPAQVEESASTLGRIDVEKSGIGSAVTDCQESGPNLAGLEGDVNSSSVPESESEGNGFAYSDTKLVEKLLTAGINRVARQLARIASADPEFVRLAIEGSLHSAALRVPSKGYRVQGNTSGVLCEDGLPMSRAEILDTLEAVGRYHLAACLRMAADDAHARFFEFTGFDYLDYNNGAVTTNGCILKRIDAEMAQFDRTLKLHKLKTTVPSGHPDVQRLERDKTLLANARRLEVALKSQWGGKSETQVGKLLQSLKREINEIRRELRTLQGDISFRQKAAWTNRGVDPLQMLALVTSFAQGWLSTAQEVAGTGPCGDGATRRGMLAGHVTHIRQAFERAGAGITEATMHDRRDGEQARRLFFVLRNSQTQDPKSQAVNLLRRKPELKSVLNAFHKVEKEEAAKHAGLEPWSNSFLAPGIAAYDFSRLTDDASSRAFVCEAEGAFTFRMQW